MDSAKKQRWRARREGTEPDFLVLTIESPQPSQWVTAEQPTWPAVVRQRRRCIRRWQELQAGGDRFAVARTCAEFGISERTLWNWVSAWKSGGLTALISQPQRPRRCPEQTPLWLEQMIVTVRFRTGWGAERIAAHLHRERLAEISGTGVYNVLKRLALTVPGPQRRGKRGCRYVRERVNDLWHIDAKGPLYLPGMAKVYVVGLVDDCSRYCTGLTLTPTRQMSTMIEILETAVGECGSPRQLMADNGTEFFGVKGHATTTRFQRTLDRLGIEAVRIRERSPETNGKVERFWQTVDEEFLLRFEITGWDTALPGLQGFRQEYNHHRLHKELGYQAPAEVFFPGRNLPLPEAPASEFQQLLPHLRALKDQATHH
ncbi:MAG: hypothetical protein CO096_11865 [Armatimonadetes bacterium CG_4_9_14_3_um_filter_66_14]|nr:MAG: hypothetical protein CO096_11865 [Armatimonadetes bacterium CG_4_9_14_3_um_filter_66_14]